MGFCHNRLDPRPFPERWDSKKGRRKKNSCLLCILGYSKHIIFSWKKITFFGWLVFFLVWTWDPHHIATKSLFCMVVVFGFKKLRLGQTPAPLVGTKSQLLLIFLKASLNIIDSSYKSISSVDGCHLFHSRVGLQNQEEARTESQLCLRVKCIGGNMSKLIWSQWNMWWWCI